MNSERLSNYSRPEFCLALKTTRERKGITLAQITAATKIPASLFAALEHNDLRYWPTGLYRRSFFRDYVRAIGLPVTELCAEFVRLFPDDGGEAAPTAEVRLAFDASWHGPRSPVRSRLMTAAIDATVIMVTAAFIWLVGGDWQATIAVVSLSYFSLAMLLFGESPAKWAGSRHRPIADAWTKAATAIRPNPHTKHLTEEA